MDARAWLLVAAFAAGCRDPVHSDRVAALGPEAPGERPGPTHRAGQPCRTCHGGEGPGEPDFSFAGTVYATRAGGEAAPGVVVALTADDGSGVSVVTNEVGNFYVKKEEWDPPFPVKVKLVVGGRTKEMVSRMGHEGGCAFCHRDVIDPWSPAGTDATTDSKHRMPHVFTRER